MTFEHINVGFGQAAAETDAPTKGLTGKTNQEIDFHQGVWREAFFALGVAFLPPKNLKPFWIKEQYLVTVETSEERLPEPVEWLKKLKQDPTFSPFFQIGEFAIEKIIDLILEIATPLKIISIVVRVLTPQSVAYVYDFKDFRNDSARYIFSGSEQGIAYGLPDLVAKATKLLSVLVIYRDIFRKSHGNYFLNKAAAEIDITLEIIRKNTVMLAAKLSTVLAKIVDMNISAIISGKAIRNVLVEATDWIAFDFHDRSHKHSIQMLQGHAMRYPVSLGASIQNLEFGGYVPNSWSTHVANAKLPVITGVFGIGRADGILKIANIL